MQTPQPPEPTMHSPSEPVTATDSPPTAVATRSHRWGLGAFFFTEGVFVVVSVLLSAMVGHPDAGAVVLLLIVPTVLAGAVAVVITVVRGNGPRQDFGLRWCWEDVRTGLVIGAVGLVSTAIAASIWAQWVDPGNATSTLSSVLDGVRLPPVLAVVIFLHVWLIAPVCEELIYRGLLWGAMERLRWSRLTAFVLSSAIFAIGHLEPERTVLLLVIALPIGLARMLTGRLTASVVAHQVNNFLPAVGMLLISLGLFPS